MDFSLTFEIQERFASSMLGSSFLASPGLSLTAVLVRVNTYLSSLLHVNPSFVRDSCDLSVIARRSNVTPIFFF